MNDVWVSAGIAVIVALATIVMLRLVEKGMRTRLGPVAYYSVEKAVEEMQNDCKQKMESLSAEYERKIQALEAEYERKIQKLQEQIDFLLKTLTDKKNGTQPGPTQTVPANQRQMLVAIGQRNAGLEVDFSIFRRARIPYIRLSPATLHSFEAEINRARRTGNPYPYIHIAAHASEEGVVFADGTATPEWLAERLRGVEIVVIAGCEGTNIGDTLAGIAEYVITMAEPVRNETRVSLSDIGIFSEVFWSAVRDGQDARQAFYTALDRSPTWIGEIAHIHAGISL